MSKIAFLPQGYQAPKSSNFYMKFQDGENKFRILTQPILGWEDWQDKKPIRYAFDQKPLRPLDPKKAVKHFWAMVVWNYAEEEIQILQITQTSIRKSLEALCADDDWGAPYFYDLKLMKSGKDLETEYTLNPVPHKQLSSHVKERFNERRCNLDALFHGEDPFSKEHSHYSEGIFSEEDASQISQSTSIKKKITIEEVQDLEFIVSECDENYRKWFLNSLMKNNGSADFTEIPSVDYPKILASATDRMEKHYERQKGPKEVDLMEATQ
jgi:hypothetical protein